MYGILNLMADNKVRDLKVLLCSGAALSVLCVFKIFGEFVSLCASQHL